MLVQVLLPRKAEEMTKFKLVLPREGKLFVVEDGYLLKEGEGFIDDRVDMREHYINVDYVCEAFAEYVDKGIQINLDFDASKLKVSVT